MLLPWSHVVNEFRVAWSLDLGSSISLARPAVGGPPLDGRSWEPSRLVN